MVNLAEIIKTNRPAIVESSLKAYVSNIRKLHEKMYKTKDVDSLEWVGDYDKVIKYLDTNMKSYLTVRNFLNALIVLILNNDKYKDALVSYQNKRDEYNDKYQQSQENGEMTSKQKENWVSLDEINQFVTEMNDEAKHLKLRKDLSVGNLKLLQDRFMVKFWITYPIRNDLADTRVVTKKIFNKLSDEDRANNNYMIVSSNNISLRISNYKTKKQYGIKTIKIVDKNVIRYMRDWLKVSPNPEYILVNLKNNKPMTANQITLNFKRIFVDEFGKKVSTTLLRHIVISHTFGKQIEDMNELADLMLHSKQTQQTIYNKPIPTN
eukprot:COSAG01_NODE_1849_length_9064_cov_212.400446_1_plen_322_part_00